MSAAKSLADLVAGDEVIVHDERSEQFGGGNYLAKVERTTATRLVVNARNLAGRAVTISFHKSNGNEVGASDAFRQTTVEVATPEALAAVKVEEQRRQALARLSRASFSRLPVTALVRMVAILDGKDPAEALLRRVLAAMKDPDADGYFDGERIEADVEAYLGGAS